jgi:hypothetical protein
MRVIHVIVLGSALLPAVAPACTGGGSDCEAARSQVKTTMDDLCSNEPAYKNTSFCTVCVDHGLYLSPPVSSGPFFAEIAGDPGPRHVSRVVPPGFLEERDVAG